MSRIILRRPANETITDEGLVDVAASLQLLSRTLARQLDINETDLIRIAEDNKGNEGEIRFQVLYRWYKQNPPTTTYGDLRKLITTGFEVESDQVSAMPDCHDVISDSGELANITDDGTNTNSLMTHLNQATQEATELIKKDSQLKQENVTLKEEKLKLCERNNELENENTKLKTHCSCKRKRTNMNLRSKNQKKIKEYFLPLSEN